jgi:hypothetical protein
MLAAVDQNQTIKLDFRSKTFRSDTQKAEDKKSALRLNKKLAPNLRASKSRHNKLQDRQLL